MSKLYRESKKKVLAVLLIVLPRCTNLFLRNGVIKFLFIVENILYSLKILIEKIILLSV